MDHVGYSLIDTSTNEEVHFWGDRYDQFVTSPDMMVLPNGSHVHSPQVDGAYEGYRLVERWFTDDANERVGLVGNTFVVFRERPAVRNQTLEELMAELESLNARIANLQK